MTANQKFAQIILVSETTDRAGYSKNETHVETYSKKASEGFPGNVFQLLLQPGPAPHLTRGDLQRSDHPTYHHFFHSPEVTLLSLLLLKFLGKKGETPQQPSLHGPEVLWRAKDLGSSSGRASQWSGWEGLSTQPTRQALRSLRAQNSRQVGFPLPFAQWVLTGTMGSS